MAIRLLLVAHGATSGTRAMIFGDRTNLVAPADVSDRPERMASLGCGPEPACAATVGAWGDDFEMLPALRGLDAGCWSGRSLDEVAAADPEGLQAWLTDATAAPHGGESLAALVQRVGDYCDGRRWEPGRHVLVVTPLVARAMAVHALGVPPAAIFRLDLAPLSAIGLSQQTSGWRLQHLGRLSR
ncbi:MAG TPA: histidine phosphatase family protein [Propionibacteriaceae bacterium]|nr:histidine phosphatase family protein [Propionibacteriaceae bacterium]